LTDRRCLLLFLVVLEKCDANEAELPLLLLGMWVVILILGAHFGTCQHRATGHASNSTEGLLSCERAMQLCNYRSGCGLALRNFMLGCAELRAGETDACADPCKKALIALASTEEGRPLMNCRCTTVECERSRARVDFCEPQSLLAAADADVVSCSIAQWICAVDSQCGTALRYYHDFCKRMFDGHKCTEHCNNSISVLRRQTKAAKLEECYCEGSEGYDCKAIRVHMVELCGVRLRGMEGLETNEVGGASLAQLPVALVWGVAVLLGLL
jgi:growth arrest-specific protein 1